MLHLKFKFESTRLFNSLFLTTHFVLKKIIFCDVSYKVSKKQTLNKRKLNDLFAILV